jgi:hypothetical protein
MFGAPQLKLSPRPEGAASAVVRPFAAREGTETLAQESVMYRQRPDWDPHGRHPGPPGCWSRVWLAFLILALVGLLPAIGSVSVIAEEARRCEETNQNPDTCQPFAAFILSFYLFGYVLLVLVPLLALSVVQGLNPPRGRWKAASWITAGLVAAFIAAAFAALNKL